MPYTKTHIRLSVLNVLFYFTKFIYICQCFFEKHVKQAYVKIFHLKNQFMRSIIAVN